MRDSENLLFGMINPNHLFAAETLFKGLKSHQTKLDAPVRQCQGDACYENIQDQFQRVQSMDNRRLAGDLDPREGMVTVDRSAGYALQPTEDGKDLVKVPLSYHQEAEYSVGSELKEAVISAQSLKNGDLEDKTWTYLSVGNGKFERVEVFATNTGEITARVGKGDLDSRDRYEWQEWKLTT